MSVPAGRWLLGAAVGTAVGVAIYWLSLRNGIHVLVAVGAGLAVGARLGTRDRSIARGVLVAVLAVVASILCEWWFRPFSADGSLGYFVRHLGDLSANSIASLIGAAALGLYFGSGRHARPPSPTH